MCKKFSAIVHAPTALYGFHLTHYPNHTHAHRLILAAAGIDDIDTPLRRWRKAEYLPPTDPSDIENLKEWRLVCDDDPADWWDEQAIRDAWGPTIRLAMVRGERDTVLGGCWIICAGARIRCLVHGMIAAMHPE